MESNEEMYKNLEKCPYYYYCIEFLPDEPARVPHRCHECTPMVRAIFQAMQERDRNEVDPIWWKCKTDSAKFWNNGAYDD